MTHAPQVAALADAHFFVSKTSSKDKTSAQAKLLNLDGRVEEVARMLAGKNISGNFIGSAKELIGIGESAPELKKASKRTANSTT